MARDALNTVQTRLLQFDSVALLGSRQTGKTTLARQIAAEWSSSAKYRDLENPADRRLPDDPVAGKSWEGFVIENPVGAASGRARPFFYRTAARAEADLVLEFALDRCWAIEIKLSSAPDVDRGFCTAADDVGTERRILVHEGRDQFRMRHGVGAMPLPEAVNEVRAAAAA